mgnify:CR=1 FL=1
MYDYCAYNVNWGSSPQQYIIEITVIQAVINPKMASKTEDWNI